MKIDRPRHRRFHLGIIVVALICQTAFVFAQNEQPRLKLEELYASPKFQGNFFQGGEWTDKGPVITYIETAAGVTHLTSFDLERNEKKRLIDGAKLNAPDVNRRIAIQGYAYNHDQSKLLIYTDSAPVWRLNTKGFYYVYEVATSALTPLSNREKGHQMFAKFSPDGRHVAFVRDRNLFMIELATMKEKQFTADGAEGGIINGTTDWVYEEEFGLRDGWSWSPDGRYLAFLQLDESQINEFVMADLRGLKPHLKKFRFPLAGEPNSEIRVGVIEIKTGKTTFFNTGTWHAESEEYEYIPRMGWTPLINGKPFVWILRMNRDQNHASLLHGDPETGKLVQILEEKEDTWIEPLDMLFGNEKLVYLQDGRHFIWQSEREGYNHLYLYKSNGELVRQITNGAWEVTAFHGYDAGAGNLYFTANAENPGARQLYRVAFHPDKIRENSKPVKISREPGTHAISLSADFRFYLDTYSTRNTPPVTRLHKSEGTLVTVLEDNAALMRTLAEYKFPKAEFMLVPGAEGSSLHAFMIKPVNFDPGKKYPLLIYTYGGPAFQNVTDSWDPFFGLWHAYLANEHDIIIACVDNRGVAGYGKAFERALYKRMGTVEPQDQLAAAKHWGALPYIDKNRIGIWGWSYGGYNTLLAMMKYDGPQTIKLGIAVAPCADWKLYDTICTERYMSTPAQNAAGYQESSPLNFIDRLQDHQRLLLVHGDQDDNTHFQGTVHLISALQRAGKQFQLMIYPGGNHSMQGTGNPFVYLHLFQTLTSFVAANL